MDYRVRVSVGGKIGYAIVGFLWLLGMFGLYKLCMYTDGGAFEEPWKALLFSGALYNLFYFGLGTQMFKESFNRAKRYVRLSDQKELKEKNFKEAADYANEQLLKSVIYNATVSIRNVSRKELSYTVHVSFKENFKEQYNLYEINNDLIEQTVKAVFEHTGCHPTSVKVVFFLSCETSFTL